LYRYVLVTATSSDYWWDSCVNDTIFGAGVDLCVGNIWITHDRTLRGALFTQGVAPVHVQSSCETHSLQAPGFNP
jgi:hypothetical protein